MLRRTELVPVRRDTGFAQELGEGRRGRSTQTNARCTSLAARTPDASAPSMVPRNAALVVFARAGMNLLQIVHKKVQAPMGGKRGHGCDLRAAQMALEDGAVLRAARPDYWMLLDLPDGQITPGVACKPVVGKLDIKSTPRKAGNGKVQMQRSAWIRVSSP